MSKEIKVLGIQVGITEDKHENLRKAIGFIEEGFAKYRDIDVICLPELYYTNPTKSNRSTIGEVLNSEFFNEFSKAAQKYNVNIITGTYPLLHGEKLLNTCLCINRQGELIGEYSKSHLFDAFTSKESDTCDAGDELGIVDFDFGRVGIAVCYELRFPELLRTLALSGAEVLFAPSAFYKPRQDQWNTLVTGTALQNLIYVVALNQYNDSFFGRSCIADPLGLITSQCSDKEGVFFGILDMEYQKRQREQIPVYVNRRPEMYRLV